MTKHFCNLGKKVVILEPNDKLLRQTAEKLAIVDISIKITSIDKLYHERAWHEVVILDEYDSIILPIPYLVQHSGVKVILQLRGKKVFAFSAITSASNERLLNICIERPKVLKFKTENEPLHATNTYNWDLNLETQ